MTWPFRFKMTAGASGTGDDSRRVSVRNCIGQIAPDYLTAVILLSIMALAMLSAYGQMESDVVGVLERTSAKDIAEELADAINSVVIMGDGGQRSIALPGTMGGQLYNLTIRANAILMRWGDSDYAYRFSTADLEASEAKLNPGVILVSNVNGKIRFERVI